MGLAQGTQVLNGYAASLTVLWWCERRNVVTIAKGRPARNDARWESPHAGAVDRRPSHGLEDLPPNNPPRRLVVWLLGGAAIGVVAIAVLAVTAGGLFDAGEAAGDVAASYDAGYVDGMRSVDALLEKAVAASAAAAYSRGFADGQISLRSRTLHNHLAQAHHFGDVPGLDLTALAEADLAALDLLAHSGW